MSKAPKEPKKPRMPLEPKVPEKYIFNNRKLLKISDDDGKDATIPFSKIIELRSQINASDDIINVIVTSATSYCGGGDYESEIESVYFEWYEKTEDPKYPKKIEEYQEKLNKYQSDKKRYDMQLEQYHKDIKVYKKELKYYQLEQMKEQKARLEAQIAKAENKEKFK